MNQPTPASPQTLKILFFALLMSQFIFLGVGKFILWEGLEPQEGAEIFLYVIASVSLIILFVGQLTFGKAKSAASIDEALTLYILTWALGESVSIFGLILPILGVEIQYSYLFFAAGIGAHLLRFPKTGQFE